MGSVDDIVAALEQAKRKLADGKRKGLDAATVLSRAQNAVSHTLGRTGFGNPVLAEMAAKQRALVEQIMRTDALIARVDQTIAEARNLGSSDGPASATNGQAATSSPAGSGNLARERRSADPPAAPFVRTQPAPSAVAEIRPHVGRDIAAGRLYGTDGKPLTPLVGPGDTRAGDGLTEPTRSMRFIRHVESNATAFLRRTGVRHAVLYTNMRPCLGHDGCTVNVADTMPRGYRLTVYQVRPNGGVRVWQFDGTGKAIPRDERA
jgi:hypothetical protein